MKDKKQGDRLVLKQDAPAWPATWTFECISLCALLDGQATPLHKAVGTAPLTLRRVAERQGCIMVSIELEHTALAAQNLCVARNYHRILHHYRRLDRRQEPWMMSQRMLLWKRNYQREPQRRRRLLRKHRLVLSHQPTKPCALAKTRGSHATMTQLALVLVVERSQGNQIVGSVALGLLRRSDVHLAAR